ncbi:MAG: radical SAM protein [Planctomycetota bacterium]
MRALVLSVMQRLRGNTVRDGAVDRAVTAMHLRDDRLHALLVFPPYWLPYQPYASLPVLAGHLRARGHRVQPLDANLACVRWLLAADSLERCHGRVVRQLRWFGALRTAGLIPDEAVRRMEGLARIPPSQWVAEAAEAVTLLRDKERFFVPELYRVASATLRRTFALISEAHFPAYLDAAGVLRVPLQSFAASALLAAARNAETNPFYEALRQAVIPALPADPPVLLGFSVASRDQIVPALTLADMLRERWPQTLFVAGGSAVTLHFHDLFAPGKLPPALDLAVAGEGEDALDQILVELGAQLRRGVPPRAGAAGLRASMSRRSARGPTGAAPDFRDLPLREYLSPSPVLPLEASRGCYWSRCEFCNQVALNPKYRPREGELVARQMRELHMIHPDACFELTDETLTRSLIASLGRHLAGQLPAIPWAGCVRPEPWLARGLSAAAREAGCVALYLGIESGSDRLLGEMSKGTSTSQNSTALAHLAAAGIATRTFLVLGYPGESAADIQQTARFLSDHVDVIDAVSPHTFETVPHAPVSSKSRYAAPCDPSPVVEAITRDPAWRFCHESLLCAAHLLLYIVRYGRKGFREVLGAHTTEGTAALTIPLPVELPDSNR